jgi:hypothetical protein
MKYLDDYGNEFNTVEEIKAYAIQNLYEDDEVFVNTLDYFVTGTELLNWIIENPTILEKFKEDYAQIIKIAENGYVEDYLCNCEKIED